jgi:protein-L-isoaspartate(D-aspartate) O-methyltransferase
MPHSALRSQMTTQQVRAWSVLAPAVLDVFERLPRERFVPAIWQGAAYADFPIPLDDGQHMHTPSVAGRALQAVAVRPSDQALEIGTGSGYLTAGLALLAAQVHSLEIRPQLAAQARSNLQAAGIANAEVEHADAFNWTGSPRFDVIVLGGSLPTYDARFEAWLKPGGRLFAVVGAEPVMEAVLVRLDVAGKRSSHGLFETVTDPLTHPRAATNFDF